jgi:hypothetical protein
MKKILSLCVAAVAALTMTAQDIAVNIKLVAQSGGESTLLLASGSGVSAADNATLVAPLANTDNVAIYVQNDERYSIFATDGAFVNLPVSFITDRTANQSYTLHFEDVLAGTGNGSLKLKDLVTGEEVTIADGGTYGPFVVNTTNAPGYAAGTNTVVNRFVINYDATAFVTSATTNEYGYATFSYTADVKPAMPAGLKVCKGTLAGETLTLNEVADVPANTGVVLFGAPNTTYQFAATTATADMTGNVLLPSSAWTAATENAYFLVGNEFKKYIGTEAVPAGKAYLIYTAGGANPAPRRIVMRFNTTTAVENVETEAVQPVKFIENGEIFIRRGENVYNAQGQMVK